MDLVCLGDNITDCFLEHEVMCPGGNCVNVAVHASRAGSTAGYIGRVGNDLRGQWLRAALISEGVDVRRVVANPGMTGYAEVRHSRGDRRFGAFDRGVAPFRPTSDDLATVAAATAVHVSYAADLAGELPELAALSAVSYDFDAHVDDGYADDLLPHVTYAFFSAAHLSADRARSLLTRARKRGATYAAATLGARGALVHHESGWAACPAPTAPILDTLGAGDAFIGTFLAGVLSGHDLQSATNHAVQAATDTCRSVGGFGHGRPFSDDPALPIQPSTRTLGVSR